MHIDATPVFTGNPKISAGLDYRVTSLKISRGTSALAAAFLFALGASQVIHPLPAVAAAGSATLPYLAAYFEPAQDQIGTPIPGVESCRKLALKFPDVTCTPSR